MLLSSRFFSAVLPPLKTGIQFYLETKDLFDVSQSFYQQNEEEISLGLQKLAKENSILTGKKVIYTYRPFLAASFLHAVSEDDFRPAAELSASFDYPPLPGYERDEDAVVVKPIEVRFEEECSVAFISHNFEENIAIQRGRESRLEIPEDFKGHLAAGRAGRILLRQGDFSYALEVWKSRAQQSYREEALPALHKHSYLSLKDILNPNGGLNRLVDDILSGVFEYKQGSLDRRKMENLLDIVRVATADEEERIIEALILEDFPFYLSVHDALFQDNLLAYMDATEVAKVLSAAPDEVLAQISLLQPREQKLYAKFFSRNRFDDIRNLSLPGTQPDNGKSAMWHHVENHFRMHKQRLLHVRGEVHQMYRPDAEPGKLEPYEDGLPPSQYAAGAGQIPFVVADSPVRVLHQQGEQLFIELDDNFKLLQVVCEQRKNHFTIFEFEKVSRGLLTLAHIPHFPRRIAIGGVSFDNQLIEGLALRVDGKLTA